MVGAGIMRFVLEVVWPYHHPHRSIIIIMVILVGEFCRGGGKETSHTKNCNCLGSRIARCGVVMIYLRDSSTHGVIVLAIKNDAELKTAHRLLGLECIVSTFIPVQTRPSTWQQSHNDESVFSDPLRTEGCRICCRIRHMWDLVDSTDFT